MDGLRTDQAARLADHRDRAFDILVTTSAHYDGREQLRSTPAGQTLLRQTPALLVSIGISAAAAMVERRRAQQEGVDVSQEVRAGAQDVFPWEVLELLRRRRLPFEPNDVELVLDLGTSSLSPDHIWARSYETVAFGVSAAADLLRTRPGSAPVLGALERAGSALDDLGLTPSSKPGELRRRIRSLVAAHAPGGLLDLSAIEDGDAWGELASEVLRSHAERWDEVQDALALFADARGSKPTRAWKERMQVLLTAHAEAALLARELLELVFDVDVVPTPAGVCWPPQWLLTAGNERILRGAAWSLRFDRANWVVPLLGRLALRGLAPSPNRKVTTPLTAIVGNAAIDSLIALETREAQDELRRLRSELRQGDVVKRIAAVLDEGPGEPAV